GGSTRRRVSRCNRGPVRVALLIAWLRASLRFRSKRELWGYAGLALVTRSSADYRVRDGELVPSPRPALILGLNAKGRIAFGFPVQGEIFLLTSPFIERSEKRRPWPARLLPGRRRSDSSHGTRSGDQLTVSFSVTSCFRVVEPDVYIALTVSEY